MQWVSDYWGLGLGAWDGVLLMKIQAIGQDKEVYYSDLRRWLTTITGVPWSKGLSKILSHLGWV